MLGDLSVASPIHITPPTMKKHQQQGFPPDGLGDGEIQVAVARCENNIKEHGQNTAASVGAFMRGRAR